MYEYLFLFLIGGDFSESLPILVKDVEIASHPLSSDGLNLKGKRIKNVMIVKGFSIVDQDKIDWSMWFVLMKGLYPPALEMRGDVVEEVCTYKCGKGVQGDRGRSDEEHGRGGRGRGNQ